MKVDGPKTVDKKYALITNIANLLTSAAAGLAMTFDMLPDEYTPIILAGTSLLFAIGSLIKLDMQDGKPFWVKGDKKND